MACALINAIKTEEQLRRTRKSAPSQTKNSKPRSDKENDPAISAINKLLKKGHNGKCAGPDAELGIES